MFFFPWRVDVPQDRWPVMNWLIILVTMAVFVLQVSDIIAYHAARPDAHVRDTPSAAPGTATPSKRPDEAPLPKTQDIPGITGKLMLRGWSLRGLFGYMWLHNGLRHLLGNMLVLWIFGSAVCAKIGNLRYLLLYVLLGVTAGVVHLLVSPGGVMGASGAINGVIGMYLVLFYQNDITCVFGFWFIVPLYVRTFAISGIWLILSWLLWDVVGAFAPGASKVAYFAHIGGFGAGFGVALLMCAKGWITMERYEKSLLQMWQERKEGPSKSSPDADYARLGLRMTEEELQEEVSDPPMPPEPEAVAPSPIESEPAPTHLGIDGFIRTACACGNAIRATRQYAGRTVRCPTCKQPIVIPAKTDFFGPAPPRPPAEAPKVKKVRDDFIHLVCPCGKRMKVPAQYAGRTGKCPHCGARFRVPPLAG
jgi:membrane associated rhomboid family serine protease